MTGRILALDPGTKRIGVAVSDEMEWIAQPLETFERRTLHADLTHIQQLVQCHEVREVIVGLPLRLSGRVGPEAESVQRFIDTLRQHMNIPVVPWDERLTSKSAEDMLIEANVSRKKRKGAVDRVAAAILLQSYLEHLTEERRASGDAARADMSHEEGSWDDR